MRALPRRWRARVACLPLASAACGSPALRLDVPADATARALLLSIDVETAAGVRTRQILAYATGSPERALPAIDYPAGTTIAITAHYYRDSLSALGIAEGPLPDPTPGAERSLLPAPARALTRTLDADARATDDAAWSATSTGSAPLANLSYTRLDAPILPAHCTRTRVVYEDAIPDGDDTPVAAQILPDGRALILLKGGGEIPPHPPSVLVRVDADRRAQTRLVLPPEIMARSGTVADGAIWVGSVTTRVHRLTVTGDRVIAAEVTTAGATSGVHWLTVHGPTHHVMGIAHDGGIFEVRGGVPTEIGRVDGVDAASDKGSALALDEQHLMVTFARSPELTIFASDGNRRAIRARDAARGYLTVLRLPDGNYLAGGTDATFTFFSADGSRPERVVAIEDANAQWVRTIMRVDDTHFWWAGKLGQGGEYVEGRGFCPTRLLGGNTVRTLVPWGARGFLVLMEGTGSVTSPPSFAFHEWVRD